MRTYKTWRGILLLVLFAVGAWAADISGQWKGEWTDSRDTPPYTFTFKQDGASLTGTVSSERGDLQIRDGKVNGDRVSFVVVRSVGAREMTATYSGRVDGGEITFKVSLPGSERDWHMTAKKVP
jgi:hypothetical protein